MIGDGSQKLTDESKEMIVREGVLHTFITRNLKYEKTPDKIYSEQSEVKKKIEKLQKKAKEKSDKDTTYYVRVDSKNKTVTLESSPTTKNPLYHAWNDVVKCPVVGTGNLIEAEKLTWTGHPIKGIKKRVEGIGNILGATTLGIGSFLGDFADRYTPGEIQYGTAEEVNRRQKTENLAVKLPTDIVVSSYVLNQVNKISKDVDLGKKGGTSQGNTLYQTYAEKATKNANSTSVMLGKYNQDGISYIEAAGKEHTYFNLGDKGWNEALNKVGESNMWEINKKFLERQLQQGKSFYLSHDPMKASGYFQKEVNFLKDNGFKFIKDGEFWKAVKQ